MMIHKHNYAVTMYDTIALDVSQIRPVLYRQGNTNKGGLFLCQDGVHRSRGSVTLYRKLLKLSSRSLLDSHHLAMG